MTLRATTMPLHKRLVAFNFWCLKATWRSGYATVCKTVYAGSIPAVASSPLSASPAWETGGGKPKPIGRGGPSLRRTAPLPFPAGMRLIEAESPPAPRSLTSSSCCYAVGSLLLCSKLLWTHWNTRLY
jgi:hypothetical protein